ncbi:germination lipoprotein GerS [Intestinibacter sp.]|uniref:germination lipoprotein GerS n=1 Tax=Intestinibacter sp. TaxID=1965304 RepID=UPI002A9118EC|nr:germination lipoprotein GerS [Intestinibacter sp.]MDY5212168.1 germination lipoprotein GerS [Intestinibacter sp.]
MNKRKTIVLMLVLMFAIVNLVGCKSLGKQTKEDIYEDFQKKITKMTSYTCKADITVINNKSKSKYIINHTYKKPSYYKLEIVEPKNLNGKTIEYYKDKIIIKNKQLDDVIELPNVGDNKLYLFIGDFVQDFLQEDAINMSVSEEQLILERDLSQENSCLSKQILYIDKKTKNPVKMEILNNEGEKKFIVNYTNFQPQN